MDRVSYIVADKIEPIMADKTEGKKTVVSLQYDLDNNIQIKIMTAMADGISAYSYKW